MPFQCMGRRSPPQATCRPLPGCSHGRQKSSWTIHIPTLESGSSDESGPPLPYRNTHNIHKDCRSVDSAHSGNHASASPSVWPQFHSCNTGSNEGCTPVEYDPVRPALDRDLPSASIDFPYTRCRKRAPSASRHCRSGHSLAPGRSAPSERPPDRSAGPR